MCGYIFVNAEVELNLEDVFSEIDDQDLIDACVIRFGNDMTEVLNALDQKQFESLKNLVNASDRPK